MGKEKIICFADNYPKSDSYLGLPLINFDDFKKLYAASPEVVIIVASYDYTREICLKLSKHHIFQYYVWPRVGAFKTLDYTEEYIHHKLMEDYEVGKYNRSAVYCGAKDLPFITRILSNLGFIDKLKFVIAHDGNYGDVPLPDSVIVCDGVDEIKDDIDLLMMYVPRKNSKLHDIVECQTMPFAVADLNCYETFIGYPELKRFKDCHKGERCFIIGNGPSLRMDDLETLHSNKEICFGSNKIYLAFDKTAWRPNYYVIIDDLILMQFGEDIYKMDLEYKFVGDEYFPFWDSEFSEGAIKFHNRGDSVGPTMPDFSGDFSAYTAQGSTITYTAIQIAAYMGFTEMYLLGVDFDYSGDMGKGENHFASDYYHENEKWNKPAPGNTLLAYKKAEIYSRRNEFRVFNATRGGKLDVFERIDFDTLFKQ